MGVRYKPHPKFTEYLIYNDGRVFSLKRGKMLSVYRGNYYPSVTIKGVPRTLHTLVLETFIGPRPKGFWGAHLNGNPKDCRLKNLKWVTPAENERHKEGHGTKLVGSKTVNAKLSDKSIREIRRIYKKKSTTLGGVALGKRFGVTKSTIQRVARRQTWSHL